MKFNIRVKTNTSQEKLVIIAPDMAEAWLKAKPIDGQANEALIGLLASHFKIKRSAVRILKGQKARRKIVEISV